MKISAYSVRVPTGLKAGEALSIPYKGGDVQSDFVTTTGANILLIDNGGEAGQRVFGGILVDATDTFTLTFGPTDITVNWHDRLRAVGDTDDLIFVFNLLATQGGGSGTVTTTGVQTLTNKTIDGDNNTIQDLAYTVLKTVLANASKIVGYDGSGVPALFDVSASAVANAIAQLGPTGILALALTPYTQTAAANKLIATDGTGKLPTALIPDSLLGMVSYQSDWNASTNSPAIPAAAAGNKGWYYVVSVAGTTSVSGNADWNIGDWLVSDGTKWAKIDNTEPLSTTLIAGLIRLATQSEVNTGTDAGIAVSPATLASYVLNQLLGAAKTVTKAWGYAFQSLTYASSLTWDVQAKPEVDVVATGNPTITASNVEDGKVYTMRFTHSGGARTPTWDTNVFKFGDDGQPTLSATTGKIDYVTFIGRTGGYLDHMGTKKGF